MREYDALVIIDPKREGSLAEAAGGITAAITKQKGKINKEENWGKQRLAYPIRKNKEAIYYKLDFSADPTQIAGLRNTYKLNPDILRVIITLK